VANEIVDQRAAELRVVEERGGDLLGDTRFAGAAVVVRRLKYAQLRHGGVSETALGSRGHRTTPDD
jgi:hypothetical protein